MTRITVRFPDEIYTRLKESKKEHVSINSMIVEQSKTGCRKVTVDFKSSEISVGICHVNDGCSCAGSCTKTWNITSDRIEIITKLMPELITATLRYIECICMHTTQ